MNNGRLRSENNMIPKLKPMPVWESILVFFLITLLIIFCFYVVRPYFERSGLNGYAAYLLSLSIVGILMLVWTFVSFYLEGNPVTREALFYRLRLKAVNPGLIGWSIGLGLFMFLMTVLFSPWIAKLIANGFISIPDQIPDYINPLKQQSIAQIKSQLISQGVLFFIPAVLILNIFGEELFWRGIVFPRQELTHGRNTFLIHGLIWAFTHLFQYWLIFPILLSSFALSYLIQRTKNTWVGIIAHMINNAFPFVIMFLLPA